MASDFCVIGYLFGLIPNGAACFLEFLAFQATRELGSASDELVSS